DVVRMFRELNELGELTVVVDPSSIPRLVDMEPEEACLSWHITLTGDVARDPIDDIFEWVEGDCELSISPLSQTEDAISPAEEVITDPPAVELNAAPVPTEKRSGTERRKPADRRKSATETASIRVGIDKVDALINMVGELVITQSMLGQLGEDFAMDKVERLKDGLAELERNTRELQESVMRIRMLPISFVFNRFPRMVHDLSGRLGKKIELKLSGEQTELDKTVMEKIGDPLVHLVRNSIDHGIETPEQRMAAGKPETGVVHLNAYHQGGNIMIEISDDGAGLNRERILAKAIERGLVNAGDDLPEEKIDELLFQPGFSTADQVSDVSGRGVGMDVVKRNITALGGAVTVKSIKGEGSTFIIRLPLTLAILDGQLVRVGDHTYIIPLVSIAESLVVDKNSVNNIAGKAELYQLRSDFLPIIRLYDTFGVEPDNRSLDNGLLVVVEGDGKMGGLLVDELLGQQQVVIKSLETNFRRVEGLSGATILGDGTVALIVDVAGVVRLSANLGSVPKGEVAAA
ncbi:MAG: chemotaxis protein CheA, partial [Gammaproteobacteria bacterium]|nr:chemotaxis protein CheA [Gammaproteobacteria bacterium]